MFDKFGLIVFILMFVFVLGFIIWCFTLVFSSKAQSKYLNRQLKKHKRILEDNKDLIEELGGMSVNMKKNMMENYEDELRDIADMNANIHKDSLKTMASAIKNGLKDEDGIYCSYCGAKISSDFVFCNKCGKKQ